MIYVRSQREGNFQLHRQVLRKVIRWYFSLGHFRYARWLSVQIFDLMELEMVHNDMFENFHLGHFCFKKTNRVCSMMALDQLHDQNSRTIKSSVASNLANRADSSAFVWWEICGAKILMGVKTQLDLKLKIVTIILKIHEALLVNFTVT